MKRFFIALTFAVFLALFSAPSLVQAANYYPIGRICYRGSDMTLYVINYPETPTYVTFSSGGYLDTSGGRSCMVYTDYWGSAGYYSVRYDEFTDIYLPSLTNYTSPYNDRRIISYNGTTHIIFKSESDYLDTFPEDSPAWDLFWEIFHSIYGFYPLPGSLWYNLRYDNEYDVNTDINFPTNAPTPTPAPAPTPIPVQTIYVPDGNGNYTIIYQYPDSNGNPTQSPYNPNDFVINVNCDCGGGSDPDQDHNKQDPYYAPIDYFSWGSVDGEFTDSPAYTAGQSLDIIKASVEDSDADMKIVSNSFNFLPPKWLTLVGLLGAVLIVAGLIRTFLGG